MGKYLGGYCDRFFCSKRKFNTCCRDCYLRNRGCQDSCKNTPDACGYLIDYSKRVCGSTTGMYRIIPTIAADPNLDPWKNKRGGKADGEQKET